MMRMECLQAFVATVEAGNLTEAAKRLRLARSVVSDRLAELERTLGVSLIRRTTRSATLTADGTAFYATASAALRDIEEAAAAIAARSGTLSGPLRIAAPVSFGVACVGPLLMPFIAQHPELRLTLDFDDRTVDLVAEGFDLGVRVRVGAAPDSHLIARKLASSPRLMVAAPKYLAAAPPATTIADLAAHRAITYTRRGIDDWRFLRNGAAVHVTAETVLQVNNCEMMRDAAEAGLGVAVLPYYLVRAGLARGTLQALPLELEPEDEGVFAIYPRDRANSARLQAVVEILREGCGRLLSPAEGEALS